MELTIQILELLYFDEQEFPNRESIKQCSLTCKSWSDHAQRLLFRSGNLHRSHCGARKLVEIFTGSTRGQVLSSWVRRIKITIDDHSQTKAASKRSYTFDDFTTILVLFPKLSELVLTCFGSFPGISAENSPQMPSLRCLHCNMTGGNTRMLYEFLTIWPTITSLKLSHRFRALDHDISPYPFDPPSKFHKHPNLKLHELSYSAHLSSRTLNWLVPTNNTLRALSIECNPEYGRKLLERIGSNLTSLRIRSLDSKSAPLLRFCPRLRELQVKSATPEISKRILDCLPANIIHLRVFDVSVPRPTLIAIAKALPKLGKITLPPTCEGELKPSWVAFLVLCGAAGIELVSTENSVRI